MKNQRILLASPHMSDAGYEKDFINEAFATNWIAPAGKNITEFEREVTDLVGSGYGAALSSGTAAIHMALKAARVGQGDIVICQDLTFSATVNPILYQEAVPVLVDSDAGSWNMDPDLLEQALAKYPQAKAVMVVHLYGLAARMDEIQAICDKYKVPLIEDAAESLGTKYKDRYTGSLGDYGIYSFNGNKIITTSGGGMLISDNEERIEKVKFWATQSREDEKYYEHKEIGYNYRMSNIAAGIGRGQLKVLKERIRQKRAIYHFYKKKLGNIGQIEFMPENDWSYPNFWLSVITLKSAVPQVLSDWLEKENIESRPVWKPMHLQPAFEQYEIFGGAVSEDLFARGLCLPSDTKMTQTDLLFVTDMIRQGLDAYE